jgi:lipoate-protein ligase A
MAIDEAILQLVGEGASPPTLRFYLWSRPWVSLGSGQTAADLDLEAVAERDWGVVRRASGGTAVIHEGQLGYALTAPTSHPIWHGDLVASYERLSRPIQLAFRVLGADTTAAPPGANAAFVGNAPDLARRVCFGALGPYELVHGWQKLIGNSQVRRRHASTQHGVVQLSGTQTALAEVIRAKTTEDRNELASWIETRVTSLSAVAGRCIAAHDVELALAEAFASELLLSFTSGELTEQERELAADLVRTKYGHDSWTLRR